MNNKIYITTTAAEKKNNLWKTVNIRCKHKAFENLGNEFGVVTYCGLFTVKKLCNKERCLKFSHALYMLKRSKK